MTSRSYSAGANRKIFRLFVIALVLMLGIILLAAANMVAVRQNNAHRARVVDDLLLLENVYSNLLQEEASQRAYLLTGDAVFEQEIVGYSAQLEDMLVSLEQSAANPLLGAAARARIAGLQQVREVYRTEGFAAAQALVQNRSGKALMDRFREIYAEVGTNYRLELSEARQEMNAGGLRMLYLLAA